MGLREIIINFGKAKIAVVGDVMLDSYIYGAVERISPEAPVPVVRVEREVYELGGAANVASNIASLGGTAFLFGCVGDDDAGEILIKKLDEKGIYHNLPELLKQTIQKTRVIGNNSQITRIDREDNVNIPKKFEETLAEKVLEKKPDIIIISDYAKGVINNDLVSRIKGNGIRIIADPKPKNNVDYSGVFLITPNFKEAKEMTGLEEIEEIGKSLQTKYRCNILITRGKDGMTLFKREQMKHFPTYAKEIYDVSGAGDSVVASIALAIAAGSSLEEAVILANHAAGIVVGKAGTATVSQLELEQEIEEEYSKIKTLEELKDIRRDYSRKGKRIVWTNGCFDILHSGHVGYLKEARKLGDCLIVGLNSDESARRLKGEGRPVIQEKERAEILSSLKQVDYVSIFDEDNALNYLQELKPEVYAKGGDYNIESVNQQEKELVESYGGKIEIIKVNKDISTTKIINSIKGR